ncbi:mapk-regulated corepressor-interacting protein 1-like [Petaurus breviceps papuanus]|uniref:mapk-regulated corepressor-interacting protein 1-like n=1 Tax=Petaurus breviceps papuanus TaxID=3040969 RepID=UPI0036DBF823
MTSSPVSRAVYNGKRNYSHRSPSNSREIFTSIHEENICFIYEAFKHFDVSDPKYQNTQDVKKS